MGEVLAKWKEMSLYRKVLLAVLAVMVLGFGVATPIAGSRKGMAYGGDLLYFTEDNGVRRYAGRNDGKISEFTVQPDGTVGYRWGDYTYGPYRVVEDPAATPKGMPNCTGIEIRREDEVLFRGGYLLFRIGYYGRGSSLELFKEDGERLAEWGGVGVGTTTSGITWYGEDGRELSEYEFREPDLSTLVELSLGPALTHRGNFVYYLLGTLLAAFNIFQICCPGLMFQLSLLGRVRNIGDAEPSEWYIIMERIEWAVLTALTARFYWMALTVVNVGG